MTIYCTCDKSKKGNNGEMKKKENFAANNFHCTVHTLCCTLSGKLCNKLVILIESVILLKVLVGCSRLWSRAAPISE